MLGRVGNRAFSTTECRSEPLEFDRILAGLRRDLNRSRLDQLNNPISSPAMF